MYKFTDDMITVQPNPTYVAWLVQIFGVQVKVEIFVATIWLQILFINFCECGRFNINDSVWLILYTSLHFILHLL